MPLDKWPKITNSFKLDFTMRSSGPHALHAFCLVARLRSFTRASAELNVSPSALSQSMRQLEAELGVRLLTRTTRQVAPTEAGEQLLERLAPALADLDSALDAVRQTQGRPAGTLRLTLPHSAVSYLLQSGLAAFLAENPALTLEVDASDGLMDIIAERFDAGIRFNENLQPGMQAAQVSRPLGFVVVASPAYLQRHGTPEHPDDLHRHACIGYRFGTGGPRYRWQLHAAGQELQLALRGPLVTNDKQVQLAAARDGVGLAYLLEPLVRDDLQAGHLQIVLAGYMPPAEALYLYYPSHRQPPAKLRALITFLRQREGLE